jgi:arsenate reductase-like glutaredoxin family protein
VGEKFRITESRKKEFLVEIEEAQYRVNTWTDERLRSRLYRAEKAWETWRESSLRFTKALSGDRPEWGEVQEFTLLEYRLALLQRQREALFRLKFEPEE